MRVAVFLSAGLHLAIIVIAVAGLPWLFNDPPEIAPAIPVEVVAFEEAQEPEEEPTPPEREAEPPPPPPPPPLTALPPPPPQPAMAAPPPPPPEPAPKPPEVKPEPEPEPEPQVVKLEPRVRPKLKTKPKPPPPDPMASVLRTVEKLKQQQAPRREAEPRTREEEQRMTIDEARRKRTLVDAVRDQVSACWNPPVGAKGAEELVVEIWIALTPDGRVRTVQAVDQYRMNSDPFFRAAAESARRAVLKCEPLKLPTESYSLWKTMTLVFNPKEMFGT